MSDNRPLYNSRIVNTYLKLIKRDYSYVNISELLDYAKMKPYEVEDQGHWFTQEQINLFHEKLKRVTGKDDIAREAGRYAASPDTIGVMRQYYLGLVGPAQAYKMVGESAPNFTRSAAYESKKIAANVFEITVTPREGVREEAFQCANRMGFFEAVSMAFNNTPPHIDHTECIFAGGRTCRYVITLDRSSHDSLRTSRLWLSALFISLFLLAILKEPELAFSVALPCFVTVLAALSVIIIKKEKEDLLVSIDSLRESTDKLIEQIDINYNNALITNDIGQILSIQTNIQDLLINIVQVLQKRLDYDRGMILLANKEKTKLIFETGFGYNGEQTKLLKKTAFHLDRPESKGVFVVSFRDQKPFLINNIDQVEGTLSLRSLAYARKLGSQSFICCPIICEDESIGVLAVDNLKSKKVLVQSDMTLLMGIAPMIGISIRNAELLEAKTKQSDSILQVLAASIDARDTLTAGHSERVTEYALGICDELGLSQDHREMIRVAALLHDYGKIGLPDAVLKKEGKLTNEEYEIVKSHSYKTTEILQTVNFEGIFKQVPEIAGLHHEKIDGSGYPRGLKGNDIPLGAKIIAVADFFEAITSKRHYREPMLVDDAFMLLEEESGKTFERKIVKAFVAYYIRTYRSDSDKRLATQ